MSWLALTTNCFTYIRISAPKSGKVRENLPGKVRESQGFLSEHIAWNPDLSNVELCLILAQHYSNTV